MGSSVITENWNGLDLNSWRLLVVFLGGHCKALCLASFFWPSRQNPLRVGQRFRNSKPMSKTTSYPTSKPVSNPASNPTSNPVSEPVSQIFGGLEVSTDKLKNVRDKLPVVDKLRSRDIWVSRYGLAG